MGGLRPSFINCSKAGKKALLLFFKILILYTNYFL